MSGEACPLSSKPDESEDAIVKRLLEAKRIAVIGLSDKPHRASHSVASYLKSVGKEIIPVHPRHSEVLGLRCYARLEDVPGEIDLVDVFRRAEFCPDVVRSAVAVGAKGVWLQSGIVSEEAREIARNAGIDFVQDRCLKIEQICRQR